MSTDRYFYFLLGGGRWELFAACDKVFCMDKSSGFLNRTLLGVNLNRLARKYTLSLNLLWFSVGIAYWSK